MELVAWKHLSIGMNIEIIVIQYNIGIKLSVILILSGKLILFHRPLCFTFV